MYSCDHLSPQSTGQPSVLYVCSSGAAGCRFAMPRGHIRPCRPWSVGSGFDVFQKSIGVYLPEIYLMGRSGGNAEQASREVTIVVGTSVGATLGVGVAAVLGGGGGGPTSLEAVSCAVGVTSGWNGCSMRVVVSVVVRIAVTCV